MKSSAPQTTMSISLAPMMAEQPPEGAQTQQELYELAGKVKGTGVKYKAFCERLWKRHTKNGGDFTCRQFTRDSRRQTFWWQEVAK